MARYVAFLRGMNLGGRRISNDDLRGEFEALGFDSVATFRASGNVVFEAPRTAEGKLRARIEKGLAEGLGYEVPTFLRSAAEVNEIAAQEPFAAKLVEASDGKLQVSLLAKAPSKTAREKVLALAGERDPLSFGKRELYWLPSGGLLESELDLKAIDGLLGDSTRRTMGTIEQLAGKFLS